MGRRRFEMLEYRQVLQRHHVVVLVASAGGHPGTILIPRRVSLGFTAQRVAADAIGGDSCAALDLAMAGARAQKRPNGGLQMRLQDVHLVDPPVEGR